MQFKKKTTVSYEKYNAKYQYQISVSNAYVS